MTALRFLFFAESRFASQVAVDSLLSARTVCCASSRCSTLTGDVGLPSTFTNKVQPETINNIVTSLDKVLMLKYLLVTGRKCAISIRFVSSEERQIVTANCYQARLKQEVTYNSLLYSYSLDKLIRVAPNIKVLVINYS